MKQAVSPCWSLISSTPVINSGTNARTSMVNTWRSDVYHLLHMAYKYVSVAVRVLFTSSIVFVTLLFQLWRVWRFLIFCRHVGSLTCSSGYNCRLQWLPVTIVMELSTGTCDSFGIAASTFVDKSFMSCNVTASSQASFQELLRWSCAYSMKMWFLSVLQGV